MRTALLFLLAALAACATVPHGARAQRANAPRALSASERALVEGSREAIIKTGLTPGYFDAHFRVARVVDRPGDRRVVWTFSVGGYEASVIDSLGFYTQGAERFDTHSAAGTLNKTADITRTITRAEAERIMRRCIGRFTNPRVEYRAQWPAGTAALLLTAQAAAPRREAARGARERRERAEREERERRGRGGRRGDAVEEEEEEEGPVIVLGAVDLSTGGCTKGRAQAGPARGPERH
ncbi:MAG TPA: hypothetical protein VF736_17630 [Pyrinomonadaceae bacterium]|jgi:hypothetical protein